MNPHHLTVLKRRVNPRINKKIIEFRANEIFSYRSNHDISGSPGEDWAIAESEMRRFPRRLLAYCRFYWTRVWLWTGLRDKKGWDFISILIVPLTLAFATYTFQEAAKTRDRLTLERTQKKEEDAAKDKWRGEVLSKYFIEMQRLLNEGLANEKYLSPRFIIAQTKTVLALQQLDPDRQRLLIQFLEAADLNRIDGSKGILYKARMAGSNLASSNLSGIQLISADLSGSILTNARFNKAILSGSTFDESNLSSANLSSADLEGASMRKAGLFRAKMACTIIRHADLSDAYLNGANFQFSKEEFSGCANGINPLKELNSTRSLHNATFNNKSTSIYRLGEISLESNWLIEAASKLPFVSLDRGPDIEMPTAFPAHFDPAGKGMKLDNGIVKVRQSGITW